MRMEGPDRYRMTITPKGFTVLCAKGTPNFSGIAALKLPKLYVVSIDKKPVYVGLTKQSIRSRLRMGWNAKGKNGYHGYPWRLTTKSADLDIWCHMDAIDRKERDMETVEAEVVFLIRAAGQWPASQTEIHFYPSTERHREVASKIFAHYKI
jgi:hypothetical protein